MKKMVIPWMIVLTLFPFASLHAQESLDALLRRAAMEEARGNPDIARDIYGAAVVKYDYSAAFLHIGNIHLRHNETALAVASYEVFLKRSPKAPEARRAAAWLRDMKWVDAKPGRTLLYVTSEWDGATVELDGRVVGETPLLVRLPPSEETAHEVSATQRKQSWTAKKRRRSGVMHVVFPDDDDTMRPKKFKTFVSPTSPSPAPTDGLSTPSGVDRTGKKDVALLVSVEDYAFLTDVPGASSNLVDWERFLTDDLGVPVVFTLRDQDATKEEILIFAQKAAKTVPPGGRLWFVFIGHGAPAPSGKEGMLVGVDGQQTLRSLGARGVMQSELFETLGKGHSGEIVVVLDACFSGRDASGNALAKGTMPVVEVSVPDADRIVLLSAARGHEFAGALRGENRPAFSYLLLGAMRGWGDDGDGTVTADEAIRFARREIATIPGRKQTPQLHGPAETVLSRGARKRMP